MNKKITMFFCLLLISSFVIYTPKTKSIEPFFTLFVLALNTNSDYHLDYFNLLRQQLIRIGIDLEIILIGCWGEYILQLVIYHNFDICFFPMLPSTTGLDYSCLYSENGGLNIFGYDTGMDWEESLGTGRNEWYLQQGKELFPPNSQERIEHYWAWQQHLMTNLCFIYPLFSEKEYVAYYSNLEGYKLSNSLYQIWGKMFWVGTHRGQKDVTELVQYGGAVTPSLDYFFMTDAGKNNVFSALLDPIIWIDDDQTIWPHLAESVTFINKTTIEIKTREGIKWATDPDGNFTDEYFDARDIYFTLYCWKYLSLDARRWRWLSKMELLDSKTIRLYIDANPLTITKEPEPEIFYKLNTYILPEHYLNQSQLEDGKTPDMNHLAWDHYKTHPFGTGLFSLTNFKKNAEIELTVRPSCWWLNQSITVDPNLAWEKRFGTFVNPIRKLRLLYYPNQYLALEKFEKGQLDLININSFPEKVREYDDESIIAVQAKPKKQFSYFGLNVREERPELGNRLKSAYDPTISRGLAYRKAIFYAIDKTEMNYVIHQNMLESVYWPIPKTMGIWCNPDIIRYEKAQITKAGEYMHLAGIGCDCPVPTPIIGQGIVLYAISVFCVLEVIVLISKKRR